MTADADGDENLRRRLRRLGGDDPAPDYVDRLREQLTRTGVAESGSTPPRPGEPPTPLLPDTAGPDGPPRVRRPVIVLAAAVLLVGAVLALRAVPGDTPAQQTAAASPELEIGEAWLRSIVEGDRDGFVALHVAEPEVNDTLLGFSRDAEILTEGRIGELYFAGFDAFQASLAVDGDFVRSSPCVEVDTGVVRCGYRASLIGSAQYSYVVTAELTVEDGLITRVVFETTTDPADLRDSVEAFFAEAATDEDRACMALGFNTVGCGEHESDFMHRYVDFHQARTGADG